MENKKPLILVSNDDGVMAKGINELVRFLRPLGEDRRRPFFRKNPFTRQRGHSGSYFHNRHFCLDWSYGKNSANGLRAWLRETVVDMPRLRRA